MKLILHRAWPSPTKILQAGTYEIPRDISLSLARCARADAAGDIVTSYEAAPSPETISTLQGETKEGATLEPPGAAKEGEPRGAAAFLPEAKEQGAASIDPPGITTETLSPAKRRGRPASR
jgi:hypothetical protein